MADGVEQHGIEEQRGQLPGRKKPCERRIGQHRRRARPRPTLEPAIEWNSGPWNMPVV